MNLILLLLVGCGIVAALGAGVLILQRRFIPKLQISIRGLLSLVAIVAIILGVTFGYRRNTMAQLTWIPVAKENNVNFFPAAQVQKADDGHFEFIYHARNRSIQHLIAQNNLRNYEVTQEAVRVIANDEQEAHDQLQRIQESDTIVTNSTHSARSKG